MATNSGRSPDGSGYPATPEPVPVSALREGIPSAMNCRYCEAAGLLEEYYNPRERRCAFPNEGRFVRGGGWGCPVEDALCELIREDSRVCQRFFLGDDAHGSLTRLWELWGDEAKPTAIWATWYKSRGHFEQIMALGWSEHEPSAPLLFDDAVELIRSSRKQTHYHHLFAQAIEAGTGETRQRLDPKDESAVGATDAPTQSGQE